MLIRRAEPDDIDTVVEFNARLAEESEGVRLDRSRLGDGVRAVLEDEGKGLYFLAVSNGGPVGQLGLTYEWSDWRNGVFWWLQSVFVLPRFRRQGVLRALHDHVLGLAEARGVCGIRLYVERENESARTAYSRLGIRPASYLMHEADFVLNRAAGR